MPNTCSYKNTYFYFIYKSIENNNSVQQITVWFNSLSVPHADHAGGDYWPLTTSTYVNKQL